MDWQDYTKSSPRFPKMPPRLRPVPERNEIESVSNDSGEVLFTLATFRAADYARQMLNAVYETEGAYKHLHSSGSRTPTGG